MKNAPILLLLTLSLVLAGAPAAARAEEPVAPAPAPKRARPPKKAATAKTPEEQERARKNQSRLLQRNWGVDIIGVRVTSSGWMLRFDYRVLDPVKAQPLTNRKVKPFLIDETSHTALAVPAMENVGELRQVAPLEVNRTYFVIFGNPAGLVKKGGTVTLIIGNFRVEGLKVG